jgi:hypothetical protein
MTRKQKIERTKTLVDVTVPAGSEAMLIPYARSERMDIISVLISHDKDGTSEWTMPREDAIRLGIIGEDKTEEPVEGRDNVA